MGNLANEMEKLIAEDPSGLKGGASAAPGTVDNPPPPAAPPAGASNTETADGSGPPEAVPYARFKEVNDRYSELRGYEQLREFGYDPDSLGRLASFEAMYLQDPTGTWVAMADNIDLPQEVRDAIEAHLKNAPPGPADGRTDGDSPTTLQLPEEVKKRLEIVDRMEAERESQLREAQLQDTIGHWDELDKKDGIKTSQMMKLMAISAMAASGQQFRTIEELAEAARRPVVDYRSETLGSAIQRTGHGGAPLSLPGTGDAPAGEPRKFTDLKSASKAAEAAILAGNLPPLVVER